MASRLLLSPSPSEARESSPDTLFVTNGKKHGRTGSDVDASSSKRANIGDRPSSNLNAPTATPESSFETIVTSPSAIDYSSQKIVAASDASETVLQEGVTPNSEPDQYPRNKPHHPGFHPSVAKVEDKIRDICHQVISCHKELDLDDDVANAFIDKLSKRVNDVARSEDKEIVALLGDMGIGKSEAYEALLGQIGIAIKSDSGRGTHFPIEGHGRTRTQTSPYEVVLVWKLVGELRDAVTAYCEDVYAFLSGPQCEDDPVGDIDDSDEEADGPTAIAVGNGFHDRQYQYEEALKHLLPLLHEEGDPDFGGLITLGTWLETQYTKSVDIRTLVDVLLKRISALRQKHGIGASTNSISASNTKQVIEILQDYSPPTHDKARQQPFWERSCHLKEVRIHCDNDLGTEGIIVADVPGRNDPDLAMSLMIEQYVTQSKRYIVMASAGRPVTKDSDKHLREAIRSRKPTIFVVTKIDVKDPVTSTERKRLTKDQLADLVSAESAVEEFQTQLQSVEAEQIALKAADKHQEANTLDKEVTSKKARLSAAEAKLHQLSVEARNRKEELDIRVQYEKLAHSREGSSKLQVVFISAKEYGKHLRGEPTLLDLEATGVPRLFRLLYRSVASKRMTKLQRLCRVELPGQLLAIQRLLNKTPLQRHHEFRETIPKVFDKHVPEVIAAAQLVLKNWLDDYITQAFKHGRDRIWPKDGAELLRLWTTGVRGATFHAFCKKYGDWHDSLGDRSWNFDIQEKIAGRSTGVADCFNSLLAVAHAAQGSAGAAIVANLSSLGTEDLASFLFRQVEMALADVNFPQVPGSKYFVKARNDEKLVFREKLNALFEEYKDAIQDVKNNTVVKGRLRENDTTYIGIAMKKTYEAAAAIDKKDQVLPPVEYEVTAKGRRRKKKVTQTSMAHDLRVNLIRGRLARGAHSVWRCVQKMVEADLQAANDDFVVGLDELLVEAQAGLLLRFDALYAVEGLEEDDSTRARSAPLREVVERMLSELPSDSTADAEGHKRQEGELELLLEECETWAQEYPEEQED
ncbi:putative P-loop containing nucleoside triphosphate hydrolase [Septoria linicola]|nr:putative P-loop containing nucleoside triphosphate hydrolase [Septoria linicola]